MTGFLLIKVIVKDFTTSFQAGMVEENSQGFLLSFVDLAFWQSDALDISFHNAKVCYRMVTEEDIATPPAMVSQDTNKWCLISLKAADKLAGKNLLLSRQGEIVLENLKQSSVSVSSHLSNCTHAS